MRGIISDFNIVTPPSLNAALALLKDSPGKYQILAGGTDVMVMLEAGKLKHRDWISAQNFTDLQSIDARKGKVVIGATVCYDAIRRHPVLRKEFPNLCQAALETGSIAIQSRGTLGGNIANGSPAADSPPALLAYGAELELVSAKGNRVVSYDTFHTDYKKNCMGPDEIISKIILPRSKKPQLHYYKKVGTRTAQAISKVVLAATVNRDNEERVVRIAVGSVGPTPMRLPRIESLLSGSAKFSPRDLTAALEQSIAPHDDVRSTKEFRLHVTKNLLLDFADMLFNK